MVYKQVMIALAFFAILGGIILDLVIFNAHVDVQQAPYDQIAHKRTFNRLSLADIVLPFAVAALFMLSLQIIGVLIMAAPVAFAAYRVQQKKIYLDATTNFQRIKREETLSIVKVVVYFVAWIYALVKFILSLIR